MITANPSIVLHPHLWPVMQSDSLLFLSMINCIPTTAINAPAKGLLHVGVKVGHLDNVVFITCFFAIGYCQI